MKLFKLHLHLLPLSEKEVLIFFFFISLLVEKRLSVSIFNNFSFLEEWWEKCLSFFPTHFRLKTVARGLFDNQNDMIFLNGLKRSAMAST